MKVLSLQEPYATFVAKGYKKIETRSWKTNYRGDILIHASRGDAFCNAIKDEKILDLMKETELQFGKIICKARIVDCVKMDEDLIKRVRENDEIEYLLGIYEVGRYAWFLEDVEVLESPIEARGRLNLWEYNID